MDYLRSRGIGVLLLSIYAIFAGLVMLFHLTFNGEDTVLALLLLGAGIFLLIGR